MSSNPGARLVKFSAGFRKVCSAHFHFLLASSSSNDRLVGQVVKASAPKGEGPELESRLRRDFSGSCASSGYTLPGAGRYSVSAVTGRPDVSIL